MALTFPLAMPANWVGQQVFEPSRLDYASPETGGRFGGVTAGPPRWAAEWSVANAITDVTSDQVRAFVAALRGAQKRFYGKDVSRPYPRLYMGGFTGLLRAGGGSFDGSATTWSQSTGAGGQALLTLTNLPAALQLSIGDYVGHRWTTGSLARRGLTRLLESATTDGSGNVTVAIEPAIPGLTPSDAVAYLDNPVCIMGLVPGETRLTDMDRRRRVGGRIVAVQEILE
ncbi:hypothetical protein [Phenylobacterium sp.]|uniref:hypothetical protein n=1 Tax=Phenylobacterium sp. TaxID=1871053 RepID=UPI002736323A|nr:hypothetical protein [Phenylobacterium sp.]MDP3853149.1 hypothetical protein [Phenylobacterium sp.]